MDDSDLFFCTKCGAIIQITIPDDEWYNESESPCCKSPNLHPLSDFKGETIWMAMLFGVAEDFNIEEK